MVEREAADERAGGEPLPLQQRRRGRLLRIEAVAGVVADAVLVRIQARQHARMRHERDDGVGVREAEARAARRQLIEVGRRRAPAIRPERVGAQRVDGDQEDVAIGVRRDGERSAAQQAARADG